MYCFSENALVTTMPTAIPPPVPSFTPTWHTSSYPAISPTKPATKASLTGKSILITAGGGSIGSAAARSFAAAGAAHIALLSRQEDKLKSAASSVTAQHPRTDVSAYSADVLDKGAIDAAFAAFTGKVGAKIDVVVSGAGWGRVEGLIKDADAETWLGDLDVNLKGSFLVAQAALRHMADDGVLINLASAMSFAPLPCVSAYSVGKAGAVRLFDLVQLESPELRVVNVQPGIVDSAMNRENGISSMDAGAFLAFSLLQGSSVPW